MDGLFHGNSYDSGWFYDDLGGPLNNLGNLHLMTWWCDVHDDGDKHDDHVENNKDHDNDDYS